MHLENLVDLVVESLGGAAQLRFVARRLAAKARLAGDLALGGDAAMELTVTCLRGEIPVAEQTALQGKPSSVLMASSSRSSRERGYGRAGTPPAEYDSEAGDDATAEAGDGGGEESGADEEAKGPRCDGCAERGHIADECPHRDSSEDEGEEETGSGSGEDY
jgi:hypothetical protein